MDQPMAYLVQMDLCVNAQADGEESFPAHLHDVQATANHRYRHTILMPKSCSKVLVLDAFAVGRLILLAKFVG